MDKKEQESPLLKTIIGKNLKSRLFVKILKPMFIHLTYILKNEKSQSQIFSFIFIPIHLIIINFLFFSLITFVQPDLYGLPYNIFKMI